MLVSILTYGTFKGKVDAVKTSRPPMIKIKQPPLNIPINPPVKEGGKPQGPSTKRGTEYGQYSPNGDTLLTDFQAFSYTGWYPPDPQLGVGPNHVVVAVNGGVRMFTKSGSLLYDNTLAGFFYPVYPGYGDIFDPKVAYDLSVQRWYIMAVYVSYSPESAFYYLAVSRTSNPTAGWYYYKLDATLDGSTPTGNLADYPGLGFNDRWILLSSNQFTFSWSYRYGKVRVISKAEALSGSISGWTDFWGSDFGTYTYTIKPARSISSSSTAFLVRRKYNGSISLWKVSGPVSSPTLSSRMDRATLTFSTTDSVPQMGTPTKLEAGDFFGILGATYYDGKVYLTFGETHPLDATLSSSRLVILDTTPAILEDIQLYESGYSWIYPYVGVSPKGLVVVFTRVGNSSYPSVYYVSRPTGEVSFSPPHQLKNGSTWYVRIYNGRNRWGDYFGAACDPSDSSIWFVGEYPTSTNEWGAWVGRVDFTGTVDVVEQSRLSVECKGCEVYDVSGRKVVAKKPGVYFVREGNKLKKVILLRP